MATLVSNSFSSYEMTEDEYLNSCVLTLQQVQNIKTQISVLAEQKLGLVPDAHSFNTYIQQEASLRGQITALTYLLDLSDAAVKALNTHT